MAHHINIVFVCIENSNRSQMAEAFARLLGGEHVCAYSAGSRPSGTVNPKAIAALRGFDYDLSTHHSKSLDVLPSIEFDAVITMGCGDACPHIRARFYDDWSLPDPSNLSPEAYSEICQTIRSIVKALLGDLGVAIDTAVAEKERT